MQISLRLLATGKQFVPIAVKRGAQTRQRGQAGNILSGFDILNVARTCSDDVAEQRVRDLEEARNVGKSGLSYFSHKVLHALALTDYARGTGSR